MKNFQIALTIILSLTILTAWKSPSKQIVQVEDVVSMQVVRNFPGAPDSPLCEMTNEQERTIIFNLIGRINSSKPVHGSAEFNKYPTVIKIIMNDGKTMTISKAYNWVHTRNADGSGFSSSSGIKDEIVIRYDSKRFQAKSKELFNYLQWLEKESNDVCN
ncbi:hypothetical protein [Paenibacillus sp. R14(2021)]|uniref:hypothetical protein n=1 Tax=Paenibacillus sp. R14(2021) TaxID=2859228 RepID=UPI001C614117|nr:hypothetical protein [Paenibacillus sp. R14(2021)]